MTHPNGQPEGEPVNYADVLDYWQGVVLDLHSRLSVSAAQLKNRDREIENLKNQLSSREIPKTPGG